MIAKGDILNKRICQITTEVGLLFHAPDIYQGSRIQVVRNKDSLVDKHVNVDSTQNKPKATNSASIMVWPWFLCGSKVLFVVFAFPCCRACCRDPWFLVVVCSVLHWSVEFPPKSQVRQPKEPCQSGKQKSVPSHPASSQEVAAIQPKN